MGNGWRCAFGSLFGFSLPVFYFCFVVNAIAACILHSKKETESETERKRWISDFDVGVYETLYAERIPNNTEL